MTYIFDLSNKIKKNSCCFYIAKKTCPETPYSAMVPRMVATRGNHNSNNAKIIIPTKCVSKLIWEINTCMDDTMPFIKVLAFLPKLPKIAMVKTLNLITSIFFRRK